MRLAPESLLQHHRCVGDEQIDVCGPAFRTTHIRRHRPDHDQLPRLSCPAATPAEHWSLKNTIIVVHGRRHGVFQIARCFPGTTRAFFRSSAEYSLSDCCVIRVPRPSFTASSLPASIRSYSLVLPM